LIPGDPAVVMSGERATPEQVAALKERLGLNQPLPLQYLKFLLNLIRLDLGNSIISGVPIAMRLKPAGLLPLSYRLRRC
jgi:peptide/nickel transport system permease protein